MINKIKQRYFSNTNLYLLVAAAVMLVMLLSAWYVMQQRQKSFNTRLSHLHQLQLNQLAQVNYAARQQVMIAAQLVASDQNLKQLLLAAAESYRANEPAAMFDTLRQQALPLINHYWQTLLPYGASQLHLHLAPDAYTLLRAHRPERHSDRLADIRPLVMHSLNSGKNAVGIELGKHGLGLRAVVPVIDPQGLVQGAVELGVDLQKVFQQAQTGLAAGDSEDATAAMSMAMLVASDITAVLNKDMQQSWYQGEGWSTAVSSALLRYWLDNNALPRQLTQQQQLLLDYAGREYLVSLLPMPVWGEDQAEARLLSVIWQDVTAQINTQQKANKLIWLIWLAATLLLLALGVLLVSYLRRQAQHEVAGQQALLKQQEQKLSALYQLSPLPILLNRFSDGAYIEANPAMEQLVGYTPEELKQLSYWDLTPECYAEAEQQQLKALTETGRYGPYIKQYRHKNGDLIDIELNGVLFNDAQDEKFIWSIIKDIREIKRLEKLKDDFVSTVSHELRTPLTSISGSLGLVLGGAGGALSPKAEKLLSIAHKNSQRLNLLINDLLDIEKLMAGKMRFDEAAVALPRLLHEALEQHQPFALQHNVSLTLQAAPDVQLWIDTARIQQVLTNFLSNAVKFSPSGAAVILSAELQGQNVRISVQDQGPGIAAADQPQLFKRFSQLNHAENQAKGGTGLGLAISREIARHSGGDVGVKSAAGQGATFWLELPLYQPEIQAAQGDAVLVLEDDADTAHLLCEFLRAQHYAPDWAADTAAAWQKLASHSYVAMTLDLKLHNDSGADFFLRLRDNPVTANLPVLVVSAFVEHGKLQLAALAHALDWLEKPVTPELLGVKLGQLLSQLPTKNRYQRILHIEDDQDIVTIMRMQLESLCDYQAVASLTQARKILQQHRFDLILLDLGLPDGNGIDVLPDIVATQGDIPVVIFSAQDLSPENKAKVRAVYSKSRINTEVLAKYLKNILNSA
ncbi:response regulator [Rheinheimera maricola]|uniref:histidine kinase n=1 Tax=Rheinheimera maricola TaxID=2793282 RepID=A0ABS7XCS7_9GAMM|nr:response regulator [Rheinheimera maricola]MBZ9612974.1 response regulator [Rheinheimera maricola]